MSLIDTKEWYMIADDDLYAAKLLNEAYRKPLEIIVYHCAQATEKYLKGYLVYNGIIPQKTHDLKALQAKCFSMDTTFKDIKQQCEFLNNYSTDTRYPYGPELTEDLVNFAIKSTEKVKNFEAFQKIRAEINNLDSTNP